MNFRHLLLLSAAVVSTGATFAMGQSSVNQLATTHKTLLDNGLTILVREDHSAPVVTAQVWCRAGSITEGSLIGAGLSHVLEHMLFKGTTTRGVAEIAVEVEDKGGYINAFTSFDKTVYYINLPAPNWQNAVDILADCMMNATLPADELAKEKNVILREMAMGEDDPGRRSSKMLWATAYTTHPFRHPVIGYRDIYDGITREDVMAYYKKMYVPNNLTFVVVGDIDANTVVDRIRELTKDFKRVALEPPYIPAEPPQLSMRTLRETAPNQQSHLYLAWHIPSITSPDVYPLDVLAIIAGQGRSSRLYRRVLQEKELVHAIDCSSYTPSDPGLFVVSAEADGDKRDAAVEAIREEIERFRNEPVTDTELRKAIKIAISSQLSRLTTMEGQALEIGSNYLTTGDPDFGNVYLENLRQVRAEDLRRVATQYFTNSNLTVTSLDPATETATTAKPATATAGIEITKFELPNGIRLLVREDPKLPLVDIRALCRGGVLAETAKNSGITQLTARMLLKGTKQRTAEAIADSIEAVGGSISHFSGNHSFGVQVHVMDDDLDLALDVLADVLANPTFPEKNLERERQLQLAAIRSEQDQIIRAAQQLLRTALFEQSPYRLNPLGTADTVNSLTRADLAAFHDQYVVPNNMVITVFGNIKAKDIENRIQQRFGSLVRRELNHPAPDAAPLTEVKRVVENQPREQAVLLIGYRGGDMFHEDRYALDLLVDSYSGQGSRLFQRVRDELGLCYYIGAYQLLGLVPGYFTFYVGTEPDKVEVCEKEILAELETLKTSGLTEKELDQAKNSLLGQLKVRMQSNTDLSMMIGLDELYGLGYNAFRDAEEKYRRVTPADIQQVARKYFPAEAHAVAIVRPPTEEEKN